MPKRKIPVADLASDDDQEFEASDSSDAPVTKKLSKDKKSKKARKSKDHASDDDDDEDDQPMAKVTVKPASTSKRTAKKPQQFSSPLEGDLRENEEGEKYVDLGSKKRASVSNWQNKTFINIREFYVQNGEEKPGKKGIMLNPEQWEILKRNVDTIDALLKGAKK